LLSDQRNLRLSQRKIKKRKRRRRKARGKKQLRKVDLVLRRLAIRVSKTLLFDWSSMFVIYLRFSHLSERALAAA
jgi:hypothetical protein